MVDIETLAGRIELDDALSGALTQVARHVEDFGKKFDNAFGAIALGAGTAIAAVAGITAAVITLGTRGSDINDVAATLDHFAGGAENATKIVENLRRGVKGTVTDFDLMKTSSRLLSANVKLNAEDFGVLGQAAFVLQNRGLGGTKEMMDLVSNAMVTGRTRSLAMALGVQDNAAAQEKFAKSIGKTTEELTASERVLATRTAVMAMLKVAVKDAGDQALDFGEILEKGTVKIKNWFDELASRVAASPKVMGALTAIGDQIAKTFGGAGKTALETIVKWIDRFADAVTKWGPIAVIWLGKIFDGIKSIWNTVQAAWDSVPDWFKKIALEAGIAGVAVIGVDRAITTIAGPDIVGSIASFATIWAGFGAQISKVATGLRDLAGASLLAYKLGGLTSILEGLVLWAGKLVAGFAGLLPGLTGVGTAIGLFLISPLGLVTAAVATLLGGVRLLTGSWDFLMKPLKAIWQILKDLGVIAKHLGGLLLTELAEVGRSFKSIFIDPLMTQGARLFEYLTSWADKLKPIFEVIKAAFFIVISPIVAGMKVMQEALELLHKTANRIREENASAVYVPQGIATNPEGYDSFDARGNFPGERRPNRIIASPGLSENLEATQKLFDELTGADLAKSVKELDATYRRFTPTLLADSVAMGKVTEKVMALAAAGAILTPRLAAVRDAQRAVNAEWQGIAIDIQQYEDSLRPFPTLLDKITSAGFNLAGMPSGIMTMTEEMRREIEETQNLMNDPNLWEFALAPKVPIKKDFDLSKILFGVSGKDFGPQLAQVMLDATTGGGDVGKSVGLFVGQSIGRNITSVFEKDGGKLGKTVGDKLGDMFSKVLPDNIGAKLGGAVSSMIPIIGSFIGPVIGKIGSWMEDNFFGGKGKKANDLRDSIKEKFGDAAGAGMEAFIAPFRDVAGVSAALEKFSRGTTEEVEAGFKDLMKILEPRMLRDQLIEQFEEAAGEGIAAFVETLGNARGVGEAYERFLAALSPEDVQDAFNDLQKAMGAAQKTMDRWGLSLDDLKTPVERFHGFADTLVDDLEALRAIGFKDDAIAGGMAGALNDLVAAALDTGQKIPPALQPMLETLIKAGGLTEELASKMLGLPEQTRAPWQEMKAIADEFKISLDDMGKAFHDSKLTEEGQALADKWKTLVENGANIHAVVAGMGPAAQEFLQEALKWGTEIPASMRPMFDVIKNYHLLTDASGQELKDLSGLKFGEEPVDQLGMITESTQRLIDKMSELIGKIGEMATGLSDLNGLAIEPPDIDLEQQRYDDWMQERRDYEYSNPGGEDSTGLERYLSDRPIVIENTTLLDGREVARNQVRYIPSEMEAAGL